MSTRKVLMLYGERLVSFSKRVPESKKAEIEAEWILLLKKYEKPTLVEIVVGVNKEVQVEKPKVIKEPTSVKSVPFTTKSIKVNGYRCDKEEDSDVCYWKDTNTSALMFDDELHLKEYLIKHKPK